MYFLAHNNLKIIIFKSYLSYHGHFFFNILKYIEQENKNVVMIRKCEILKFYTHVTHSFVTPARPLNCVIVGFFKRTRPKSIKKMGFIRTIENNLPVNVPCFITYYVFPLSLIKIGTYVAFLAYWISLLVKPLMQYPESQYFFSVSAGSDSDVIFLDDLIGNNTM